MLILQRLSLCLVLLIVMTFTAAAAEKRSVVLFDEAHGEKFLPQEESPLALTKLGDLFIARGFKLRVTKEALTPASLADVDAVVISGPFAPFAPQEIDALYAFVQRGGHLT